jgi:RimJ/RimL family protein N-acetyltransferase
MANSHFPPASGADAMRLRRAEKADLGAVMALERLPGYEALVGRSSRAEHEEMLASPRHAYWLGFLDTDAPFAFAILRDLDNPHGNLYLQRVAVDAPGKGRGTRFLESVIDRAFAETAAHRFHLDCFLENARARRAYQKLGLTHDGILREAYLASDGTRRDLALMAITRPEWRARRRAG